MRAMHGERQEEVAKTALLVRHTPQPPHLPGCRLHGHHQHIGRHGSCMPNYAHFNTASAAPHAAPSRAAARRRGPSPRQGWGPPADVERTQSKKMCSHEHQWQHSRETHTDCYSATRGTARLVLAQQQAYHAGQPKRQCLGQVNSTHEQARSKAAARGAPHLVGAVNGHIQLGLLVQGGQRDAQACGEGIVNGQEACRGGCNQAAARPEWPAGSRAQACRATISIRMGGRGCTTAAASAHALSEQCASDECSSNPLLPLPLTLGLLVGADGGGHAHNVLQAAVLQQLQGSAGQQCRAARE